MQGEGATRIHPTPTKPPPSRLLPRPPFSLHYPFPLAHEHKRTLPAREHKRNHAHRSVQKAAVRDDRIAGNESVRRKSTHSKQIHVTTVNVLIGDCHKLYDYCKHPYWPLPCRDITTPINNATFGQNCSCSSFRHRAGRGCQKLRKSTRRRQRNKECDILLCYEKCYHHLALLLAKGRHIDSHIPKACFFIAKHLYTSMRSQVSPG